MEMQMRGWYLWVDVEMVSLWTKLKKHKEHTKTLWHWNFKNSRNLVRYCCWTSVPLDSDLSCDGGPWDVRAVPEASAGGNFGDLDSRSPKLPPAEGQLWHPKDHHHKIDQYIAQIQDHVHHGRVIAGIHLVNHLQSLFPLIYHGPCGMTNCRAEGMDGWTTAPKNGGWSRLGQTILQTSRTLLFMWLMWVLCFCGDIMMKQLMRKTQTYYDPHSFRNHRSKTKCSSPPKTKHTQLHQEKPVPRKHLPNKKAN